VIQTAGLSLRDFVAEVWALRKDFDLTGVGYGKVHWPDSADVLTSPFSYYYFLAGAVRLTGSRRIVEVGTHQGGSARALAAGFTDVATSRLVTFDITDYGARMFRDHQVIKALELDSNSEMAFDACMQVFGWPKADLVFIDSTHDFWTTLLSFTIYTNVIRCPLVILDDITLNPQMSRLWNHLVSMYGLEHTIDATEVFPEIRTGGGGTRPGFGVVRIPDWQDG
jgi:hypothetical protein